MLPGSLSRLFLRQRLTMFLSREHHTDLDRLSELVESGELILAIAHVYRLDQVPDALRHLETGQITGEAVIGITGS